MRTLAVMPRLTPRRTVGLFACVLSFATAGAHDAHAQDCVPVSSGFAHESVVSGLTEPTSLAFLPDGRLLVIQKSGEVVIADLSSTLPVVAPTGYLTLADIDAHFSETGLLDITLDPDFATNGLLYLYYAHDTTNRFRVSSFVHSGSSALPSSETLIWQDDQNYSSCCHFGGAITFGPDGMLFLSLGDKTPHDVARSYPQDLEVNAGKIHRMTASGSAPLDNPFHDGAGSNVDTIWALGSRNPFRMTFDAPTGRLLVADVGDELRDELNLVTSGANFGWPNCEGLCGNAAFVEPVFSYDVAAGASITGGVVYRGSGFPSQLDGAYFYGDYVRGWMRYLTFDVTGTTITGNFSFATGTGGVVAIDQGPDGALYYVDYDAGQVRRFRYTGSVQTHDCDDGDPCTSDTCDGASQCAYEDILDNTACNDGDICTMNDSCSGGSCIGEPILGCGVTTTTTLPASQCGNPVTDSATVTGTVASRLITATDALATLHAAVGLSACDLCVCDVNNSGVVTAADALAILREAVGLPAELICPPC